MLFIGTRRDFEPGILAIEAEVPLHYVATGFHADPTPEEFQSALEIPEFGQLIDLYYHEGPREVLPGDYMSSQDYLVCSRDTDFVVRTVPQVEGGVLYYVEAVLNPNAFVFTPGGIDKDGWLFGGAIGGTRTMTSESAALSKRYFLALTKSFKSAIGNKSTGGKDRYKIGPEALDMLMCGSTLRTVESLEIFLPEKTK